MLSTTDPDVGVTQTYTFVVGTGDDDNASFAIVGNEIQTLSALDFETKSSYTVRIRSTDANGLFAETAFAISVTNVNEEPASIALSNDTVPENTIAGTTIGLLSSTDPDVGDTQTYTFVVGTGDDDNASFAIVGNEIQTLSALDFETKSSYTVRVRSTDANGLFVETAFVISVTNVNEEPTAISLSNNAVPENTIAGTTIGMLSSTDPDVGDTHTYTFVVGTGDDDNASFAIVGNEIQTLSALDFETKTSYTVRVRSTDANGLLVETVFVISVTNVNEEPTAIALSNSTVANNSPSGTVVGLLSSTDLDAGDSHTYILVVGLGDSDNANFAIVGNELRTAGSLDFGLQSVYNVRVRTTDSGGLVSEASFTISETI